MIGGNTTAVIELKEIQTNSIGEDIETFTPHTTLKGFLDFMSGEANSNYNTKLKDASHVFVCDFVPLQEVRENNARMIVNDRVYEIKLIDNPMGLNKHLEFYLAEVG